MLKRLTGLLLLAASCAAAQAETTYLIQYKGVYNTATREDQRDRLLRGWFKADDLDHDGVIRTSEVTAFRFEQQAYSNECQSEWWSCTLSVSYDLATGALDFTAEELRSDPEHIHYSRDRVTSAYGYNYTRVSGEYYHSRSLLWRDYTTLTVTAVPEPAAVGMLLGGLGLVGIAARRRRQRG